MNVGSYAAAPKLVSTSTKPRRICSYSQLHSVPALFLLIATEEHGSGICHGQHGADT